MAKNTAIQKILRNHIVSGSEVAGEPVAIRIDQTLTQDATGTMAYLELEAMGIDKVKTELSVSYISHIENAKRKASLESIIRIVNALGITIDELLAGVQMHNPTAYQTDIDILMEECSENEKRFIFELIKASVDAMHKNGWELTSKDGQR